MKKKINYVKLFKKNCNGKMKREEMPEKILKHCEN